MFRYYDVMEFAIGQNDLKDLLCGILGSENGLSTYNALDLLTFLASLQMIMTGIVISQSQANNANNIAPKAAYQNPADEGGSNAADPNKLNHIFGNEKHNLSDYLKAFNGNKAEAYNALEKATQQYVDANGITGSFKDIVVNVNGFDITVRGTIIDGIVKIGTAFIP